MSPGNGIRILSALFMVGEPLPVRYKDNPLKQNWQGQRDARVEPDWVLICALIESGDQTVARFERTGTHGDLFD